MSEVLFFICDSVNWIYYFAIATLCKSVGIFSMAYRNAVRGIVQICDNLQQNIAYE
ncbi:hypothetical protein LLG10_05215 [bacterium]|nr:hypothetical protein [bacterium]